MTNYEHLYHIMFNAATDCLGALEHGHITQAMAILMTAQCKCEELYIDANGE